MRRKRIGDAGCLGQTIAGHACHDELNRCFQRDAVTNRDIDRAHAGSGTQRRPYNFIVISHRRPGATYIRQRAVGANQQRFGTPD